MIVNDSSSTARPAESPKKINFSIGKKQAGDGKKPNICGKTSKITIASGAAAPVTSLLTRAAVPISSLFLVEEPLNASSAPLAQQVLSIDREKGWETKDCCTKKRPLVIPCLNLLKVPCSPIQNGSSSVSYDKLKCGNDGFAHRTDIAPAEQAIPARAEAAAAASTTTRTNGGIYTLVAANKTTTAEPASIITNGSPERFSNQCKGKGEKCPAVSQLQQDGRSGFSESAVAGEGLGDDVADASSATSSLRRIHDPGAPKISAEEAITPTEKVLAAAEALTASTQGCVSLVDDDSAAYALVAEARSKDTTFLNWNSAATVSSLPPILARNTQLATVRRKHRELLKQRKQQQSQLRGCPADFQGGNTAVAATTEDNCFRRRVRGRGKVQFCRDFDAILNEKGAAAFKEDVHEIENVGALRKVAATVGYRSLGKPELISKEEVEKDLLRKELALLPDAPAAAASAYEVVPVSEFGLAMLRGMGYDPEEEGRGKQKDEGNLKKRRFYNRAGLGSEAEVDRLWAEREKQLKEEAKQAKQKQMEAQLACRRE